MSGAKELRHPTRAAVRPALWDTRTGSADVTGEARHTYGRAPVPGVALQRQEGCAKDSYFAYSVMRDLIPSPPWGPVPARPGSPRARPLPRKDKKGCSGCPEDPSHSLPPRGRVGRQSTLRRHGRTQRLAPGCGGGGGSGAGAEQSGTAKPRPPGRCGWEGPGRGGPGRAPWRAGRAGGEEGPRPLTCPPAAILGASQEPRGGTASWAGPGRAGLSCPAQPA